MLLRHWHAPSSADNGSYYLVVVSDDGAVQECTCRQHTARRAYCRHIRAAAAGVYGDPYLVTDAHRRTVITCGPAWAAQPSAAPAAR